MAKVNVVQKEGEEVSPEILAVEILKISEAMKKLNGSRLKRRAIVALIHENSKVSRKTIEIVLNNLDELENIWLKPIK